MVVGVVITGVHLEPSHSCPSQYSLPGVVLLRMAVMEALVGVMVATHLHHLVELQLVPLPLVTCHLGVLLLQLVLATIHQGFQWVVLPHHLHREGKVRLAQAAIQHLLVDGECLHGEQLHHHHQAEALLQVLYPHLQGAGVHHHPCHTGAKEVEGGVGAKPTPCLTFLVLHLHHHHQAKLQKNMGSEEN